MGQVGADCVSDTSERLPPIESTYVDASAALSPWHVLSCEACTSARGSAAEKTPRRRIQEEADAILGRAPVVKIAVSRLLELRCYSPPSHTSSLGS